MPSQPEDTIRVFIRTTDRRQGEFLGDFSVHQLDKVVESVNAWGVAEASSDDAIGQFRTTDNECVHPGAYFEVVLGREE